MPSRLMGAWPSSFIGKTAGIALVTKLRAMLLMEGNFNYMNKRIFGHKAFNKLYALGYVPGDQYSQKESAKDA
jgi:hypothetical protein